MGQVQNGNQRQNLGIDPKQNLLEKVALTIFLFLGTLNLWTFFDPTTASKIITNWKTLDLVNALVSLVHAFAIIVILVRVWKNTTIENNEKTMWMALTILFPIVFGTYCIWKMNDRKVEPRKRNKHE